MRLVAGQGQGALLTHAILCPDKRRRRVCIAPTYTRVVIWDAIKGAWVTFPGGGGYEKGLPDVGRDDLPLIPAGAPVFWHLLHTRPCARNTTDQGSHDLKTPAEKAQPPLGR